MTKFQYAGPTSDYPTLGFSVTGTGAILDGTLSTPELSTPPDARWSVYGGGDAETGIVRYGSGSVTPVAEPTEGFVLAYSDAANSYAPTDPGEFFDLVPVAAALEEAVGVGVDAKFAADLDGAVTGLVADDDSDTAAALAATYAPLWKANTAYTAGQVVRAPDGGTVKARAAFTSGPTYDPANWATAAGVVAQSPRPTFWHDFRNKADHTIVNGELSDSGHAFQVRGQRPFIVQSGVLTMTHTQPAGSEAAYLLAQLDGDVGMLRAWVKVLEDGDPVTSPIATATMVISQNPFDINTGPFSDAAAHVSWNHGATASGVAVTDTSSMRADTFAVSGSATPRFRAQYPHLVTGVEYKIEIDLRDKTMTVTMPNGDVVRGDPNDLFLTKRGPNATWEIYVPPGAAAYRRIGFTRIEAETVDRVNQGRSATVSDLAIDRPGRILGMGHSTGNSVATAITTSLSGTLFSWRFPVPRSRRILVEGPLWIDVGVPTTPVTLAQLFMGCYIDGNSSYGRLTTVVSGRTPANNTADDAAFANRQGTMTAYATGGLQPLSLIIDIDPAFQHGDLRTVAVRAQAGANGLFTFIDSGIGGGSGSTIRRSSLKITELAAA